MIADVNDMIPLQWAQQRDMWADIFGHLVQFEVDVVHDL